jgi:hypothetical protein
MNQVLNLQTLRIDSADDEPGGETVVSSCSQQACSIANADSFQD